MDTWKKVAAFGLGLVDLTEEKAKALAEEFIARGEAKQEEKDHLTQRLLEGAQAMRAAVRSYIDTQVDRALTRLNLAKREDIERLASRVAELEDQVRQGPPR